MRGAVDDGRVRPVALFSPLKDEMTQTPKEGHCVGFTSSVRSLSPSPEHIAHFTHFTMKFLWTVLSCASTGRAVGVGTCVWNCLNLLFRRSDQRLTLAASVLDYTRSLA